MSIREIIISIKYQVSSIKYFWRWHPEVAIRYWPIVKSIKYQASSIKNISILEAGSGWLGIAPYLSLSVTGLDKKFEDKKFNLLKQVKGSILKIPFKDNSFDFIVCVDLLEHLPPINREKAINEIFRVAKKKIFLAAPCGKQSLEQDKKLDQEYRQIFGKSFSFLAEHIKYGLLEKAKLIHLIKQAAGKYKKNIQIETFGNENLFLRRVLMGGWMTHNFLIDIFFRKILLLFTPLFIIFDRSPYYRQLFFVTIKV